MKKFVAVFLIFGVLLSCTGCSITYEDIVQDAKDEVVEGVEEEIDKKKEEVEEQIEGQMDEVVDDVLDMVEGIEEEDSQEETEEELEVEVYDDIFEELEDLFKDCEHKKAYKYLKDKNIVVCKCGEVELEVNRYEDFKKCLRWKIFRTKKYCMTSYVRYKGADPILLSVMDEIKIADYDEINQRRLEELSDVVEEIGDALENDQVFVEFVMVEQVRVYGDGI